MTEPVEPTGERGQVMSENFNTECGRAWNSIDDDDSLMHCYLGMKGRITLREIVDHFTKHYPHVDPWTVELNFSTATWDEPPTEEDLARREEWREENLRRHEEWERRIYPELFAKFGPLEAKDES